MRLHHRWTRLRERDAEAGSAGGLSLVMLIGAIGLLMVLGLVMDGSAKAHALDRANRLASEAARAGLQAVNPAGDRVDAAAVQHAVTQYLHGEDVSGTAEVADRQVIVHVSITDPTKMLAMIGIDSMTVTGDGTANLVYGQ